jgi:hypothetical protein
MKIVKVYGGLGNALFQISYAMYLSEETDHIVKLDFSGLNQDYVNKILLIISFLEIKFEECSWIERFKCSYILSKGRPKGKELSLIKFINPNTFYYETAWGNLPATTYDYYFGYFQNSILSAQYSNKITCAFEKLNEKHSLQSESKASSAFLHVRRGDYLTEKALKVHGKLELDYYKRAISLLGIKHFDIFTNDSTWVKNNFKGICEFNIISTNSNFQYPDIEDLYLMSKYSTGIIANSTFSYWAALLGDNQNKRIIYPAKWFEEPSLQQRFYKLKPECWEAL